MDRNVENLSLLGSKAKIPQRPEDAILDTFDNQNQDIDYLVPFICPEFTSVCPKTGQPDFASFEIIYIPRIKMIESKALKLYLGSFRNTGVFHEDVTNRIFKDLWEAMNPKFMRVIGNFTIRGGIAIKPVVLHYAKDLYERSITMKRIRELVENWDRVKSSL